jgi:hypothetical protein
MMFSDMKLRADSIGGEIKQADADVREATLMRERAEKALETARDYEAKAITRAAEKRQERDHLAEAMAAHVKNQGEADALPPANDPTSIFNQPLHVQEYIKREPADIPGDNADSVAVDGWQQ